jgi:hypothetical protein
VIGPAEVNPATRILLQPLRNAMLVAEDVDRLSQKSRMRLHKQTISPQPPVVLRGSLGPESDAQVGAKL